MSDRKMFLKSMRMCRFCLTDQEPLTSIYERDNKLEKNSTPLHLQIMACVSIEVFPNDGMPQLICNICRLQTDRSYKFKTYCKRSDDALKLYIATGLLNKPTKTIGEVLELTDSELETQQRNQLGTPVKVESKTENTVSSNSTKNTSEVISLHNVENEYEGDGKKVQEVEVINEENTEEMTEDYGFEEEDDEEEEEEGENDYEGVKPSASPEKVDTDVFPCTSCERSFPLKQLLDIHLSNHSRERKFPCKICNKSFLSKYDLAKHESVHTGEKPFSCVVCLKTFARATLLHRHEKIHIEVPKYLCNSCDKTFLLKEALDRHEQSHKKVRPFSCTYCNKSFTFKQGMQRHMETHKQNKPHKCEYCEQSFDTPAKLARHITSHAGMRPYPCKWCSRTFLLSHHLTRHLRSHYGEKETKLKPYNYKCSECTMEFRRKDGLIGHSTIHSMVSLKCIFCFKQFDDLNFVREHVKTHMDGRIYPCEKCDYLFITQKHLDDHEQTHRNEEEDAVMEENADEMMSNQEPVGLYEDQDEDIDLKPSKITEAPPKSASSDARVRRSRRVTKIKDYAQFIKEELGSESENEAAEEEEEEEEGDLYVETPKPKRMKRIEDETIKPIVKPDGTKTYSKGTVKKSSQNTPQSTPAVQKQEEVTPAATSSDSTQSIDLPVKKLNKTGEIVEMKIGEKIVKVQKVLMTKAEVQEMARQGKIKMKGGTMLLQQTIKKPADPTKLPSPLEAVVKPQKISQKSDTKQDKDKKVNENNSKDSNLPKASKEVAGENKDFDSKKSVRTYVKKGISKVKEVVTEENVSSEPSEAVLEESGVEIDLEAPNDIKKD